MAVVVVFPRNGVDVVVGFAVVEVVVVDVVIMVVFAREVVVSGRQQSSLSWHSDTHVCCS